MKCWKLSQSGVTGREITDYRRPEPVFELFSVPTRSRRSELVRVALILSIFEMVGDAADQSLENSPGRRVDLIFERMDRVSFWNFRI